MRAVVSLIKSLTRNMERLLKCGSIQVKRQLVIYYLLHQLLLNWCICWSMCCAVGCGGELKLGRMCVSGQRLQERAPKLHTRPKSQRARKAIGLTAHVIETAKPCRPRALTRVAVVESGGGLAGSKWAWNELCEASHVSHIHNLIFAKHLGVGSARWNVFTVRVRGTGFTWHSKW